MTAQELFESEPLWKRCRKFDKWQLIHFAESYHKHQQSLIVTEKQLKCEHNWIYLNEGFVKYCDKCMERKRWSFPVE